MLHDAVMTPAEGERESNCPIPAMSLALSVLDINYVAVVKQRLQMCCSPYSTVSAATASILRTEGLRAFYRSYTTQLSMNIPFQAVIVTTYGVCQKILNPKGDYNPTIHFVSGMIGGSMACLVTMPFDVCKTLLNTQEAGVLSKIKQSEVRGIYGAAKAVVSVKGFPGFFQGLSARVVYQAPSTAIAWSVYEFFKYYMRSVEMEDGGGGGELKLAAASSPASQAQF